MTNNRVVIVQRIFSNYRKPLFDRLKSHFDLRILHSENSSGVGQTETTYSYKVPKIKYYKKETNIFLFIFSRLIKYKPKTIIHEFNPSILSIYPLFILKWILNYKIILWGQGYNRVKKFNPTNSFSSLIRLLLMKSADALIVYGKEAKNILSNYINSDKIFIAPNTLDTENSERIYQKLLQKGKKNIKEEISINSPYNLVFIGRLIQSKKPNEIIDLTERLIKNYNIDIKAHFVGKGPEINNLKKNAESKIPGKVKFHGKIFDENTIAKIIFASNLMVIPGEVGLAVVHAFSYRCPVVTFEETNQGPFHGPEGSYIINYKTGYKARNLDINDMAEFIYNYLNNNRLQTNVTIEIEKFIREECSIDIMNRRFIEAINYVQI